MIKPAVVLCAMTALAGLVSLSVAADDSKPISRDDAKKLKSPIPNTRKSISLGRITFSRYCTSCHGNDAKATVDVVADATDLTSPNLYRNGTTEGEMFRSIRDGAGDAMPPFKSQLRSEEDIWHLINFLRNLWPASTRPPVQEDKQED